MVESSPEDLEEDSNADTVSPQDIDEGASSVGAVKPSEASEGADAVGRDESASSSGEAEPAGVEAALPVARIALGLAVILGFITAVVLYFGGGAG